MSECIFMFYRQLALDFLEVIRFSLKESWHLQRIANNHDNNNSCLKHRKINRKTFTDSIISMDLFFQRLQSMTITEFLKRMRHSQRDRHK